MKFVSLSPVRVLASCIIMALTAVVTVTAATLSRQPPKAYKPFAIAISTQQQTKEKAPQVPEAEAKAAQKVKAAPDMNAKLAAAGEFLQKYPKSTLRLPLADYLAGQLKAVTDTAQKIALGEKFISLFTNPGESDSVAILLINTYVGASKLDDAFRFGASWLEKNPEDAIIMSELAFQGTDQAQRNNPRFAQQSRAYAQKAIELLEANKRPALSDETLWNNFKQSRLPLLYRAAGMLALISKNNDEAMTRFQKAAALNPNDPIVYWLMGGIRNDEYQRLVQIYQQTPPGSSQSEQLKVINARLDEVIDLYAHTVALSESKPELQRLREQAMKDLESYYKYRHNSTNGLQELIAKYKAAPSTPK